MTEELSKGNHKAQLGFALLETIANLAISALLISGVVTSIHQLLFQGGDTRDNMMSTQFVQNCGHWIKRDILMSQSIMPGDDPDTADNETMTLCWVGAIREDGQSNHYTDFYEVRYFIENNELRRNEHITTKKYDSDGNLLDTTENQGTSLISENITDMVVNSVNGTITLSITALVGDIQTQKNYEVMPRALE